MKNAILFISFIIARNFCFASYQYAFKMVDLETKKVMVSENEDSPLIPGSTLKLFTTLVALKELGPNFLWTNEVDLQGEDLILRFQGNADFTQNQLRSIFQKLKKNPSYAKIKRIIIDDTFLEQKPFPFGMTYENRFFCMAAPVHAISIDRNCFKVHLKQTKDGQLQWSPLSKNDHIPKIENHTLNYRPLTSFDLIGNEHNHYQLVGHAPALHSTPPQLMVAIINPREWIKELIQVEGGPEVEVIFKEVKENTNPLIVQKISSKKLQDQLHDVLKMSNNYVAGIWFKTYGRKFTDNQYPGSFENGIAATYHFLNQEKFFQEELKNKKMQIVDGAGLSRKNLITVNQQVHLLEMIVNQDQGAFYQKYFSPYLTRGEEHWRGIFKSDKWREEKMKKKYAMKIKTGYLDQVIAVDGFIEEMGKVRYVFSIMVNNFVSGTEAKVFSFIENKVLASFL